MKNILLQLKNCNSKLLYTIAFSAVFTPLLIGCDSVPEFAPLRTDLLSFVGIFIGIIIFYLVIRASFFILQMKNCYNQQKLVQKLKHSIFFKPIFILLKCSLNIGNQKYKIAVIDALGLIGNPETVPMISKFLTPRRTNDTSFYLTKFAAIKALGRIGDPSAVPALLEANGDNSSYLIIKAFGLIGDSRSIPYLERALGSRDPRNREEALKVLKTMDTLISPECEVIKLTLDLRESELRENAKKRLIELGRATVKALEKVVVDASGWYSKDIEAAQAALEVLGIIGDPTTLFGIHSEALHGHYNLINDVITTLNKMYGITFESDVYKLVEDLNDSKLRKKAKKRLAELGRIAILPLMLKLNWFVTHSDDDKEEICEIIGQLLGEIRDPNAIPALSIALEMCTGSQRAMDEFVIALKKINDPRAIPTLSRACRDHFFLWPNNSKLAIEALGEIGGAKAISVLNELLVGRVPGLREIAAKVLEKKTELLPEMEADKLVKDLKSGNLTNIGKKRLIQLGDTAIAALEKEAIDKFSQQGTGRKFMKRNYKVDDMIAKIRASKVVEVIKYLKDEKNDVNIQKVEILRDLENGDKSSIVRTLENILLSRDYSYEVHQVAAETLGLIGPLGTRILKQLLFDGGENKACQYLAAHALSKSIDQDANSVLNQALDASDEKVREVAIITLGKLGDEKAISIPAKYLKDTDYGEHATILKRWDPNFVNEVERLAYDINRDLAEAARGTLRQIKAEKARQDAESYVVNARNAIRTLGEIAHPKVIPILVKALEVSSDDIVRMEAVYALGKIENPEAISALEQAFKNKDANVSEAASKVLKKIQKKN